MAMSKAQNELRAAQLCKVVRDGMATLLQFELRGRALWDKAERYMITPVTYLRGRRNGCGKSIQNCFA